jgi:hypothetical protein
MQGIVRTRDNPDLGSKIMLAACYLKDGTSRDCTDP